MIKNVKKISTIGSILYTLLLSYWMLLGFGRRTTYPNYMYNLKPFDTIRHFMQFEQFNTEIWVVNLLGNIGVFIPFGFLLPLIFEKKLRKSLLIFLLEISVLELLQLITRRGTFDVDDFILNTLGFFIGFGVFNLLV